MRTIKYIAIFLFQISVIQLSFGQATDQNGRPEGITPGTAVESATATNPSDVANATTNGGFVDLDVPDDRAPQETDNYYPSDLDFITDEIQASMSPAEMAEQINEMNQMIDELRRISEEMRLENQIIRESLTNCCSASALGLSASDAYLIQNAPNPFNETTEIRYFVPGGLENVELKICNIKGETMDAIQIVEAGYGKVAVNSEAYGNGSFVYTLSVKGEVIDSKVMIITE